VPTSEQASPAQIARSLIRSGQHQEITYGLAPGYVQCNLVIIKAIHAYDFLLYCQRNQRACPLLEVTEVGSPLTKQIAAGADLRTDLPKYHVYRNGECQDRPNHIKDLWQDDLVAFLIGSGITFDQALTRVGIPIDKRHRWVCRTRLKTEQAGRFHGNLIVTMRWLTPEHAIKATQITARFPFNHGAPIHVGDPDIIGADLAKPLHGPKIDSIPSHLIPVFWACGVTSQAAAEAAKLDLMITHAPAHGFISDLKADDICLP
jgi:uncharacterized protein YcsI (UPF0317 family)